MLATDGVHCHILVELLRRGRRTPGAPRWFGNRNFWNPPVQQVKDRLRLFVLPPYSPEINRDELVWNVVKNHGVARALIRAPRDLHRAVTSRLRLLQKNHAKLARSYRWRTT